MSRMCDRIIKNGILTHQANTVFNEVKTRQLISEATIFCIDNVADYFFSDAINSNKDYYSFDLVKDFPNIAPPFNNFFMEFKLPGVNTGWVGTHFIAEKFVNLKEEFLAKFFNGNRIISPEWVLISETFLEREQGKISGPHLMTFLFCDVKGVATNSSSMFLWYDPKDNLDKDKIEENVYELTAKTVYPCLLALSFLHCKNVKLVNSAPKSLGSSAIKHKRKPPMNFYTLEIEPMRRVLRDEGQSEKTGLKKALHICRGHFAHYEEGKGLFGKLHGTYWREAHVRGSASEGVVVKDYAIKAEVK